MIEQRETLERKLSGSRAFLVFVALVVSASLVGFLSGILDDHGVARPRSIVGAADADRSPADGGATGVSAIRPAQSYLDMDAAGRLRALQRSPQAGEADAGAAAANARIITYASPAELDRLRLVALDRRDDRRAFNGAPPVIPHPVDHWEASSCLTCHGEGRVMGELRATRMPHPLLTNCAQCHVATELTQLPWASERPLFAASSFEGAAAPAGGARAFAGAPPAIPHALEMRNDCLSCHGPAGLPGIRTSHPERANCFQCHVQQPTGLE